ncbi:MAG TPA: serine/threonine-protein kinase, partial [Isosphaeraceae bacterium]
MIEQWTDPDVPEQRVDAAIADYLEAEDRGEAPDRRVFLARYPDVATELETFFADHDGVGRLAGRLQEAGAEAPTESDDGPAAFPDLAGLRQVGDYEILEPIGRGGMGVVFKARQLRLNRIVALKMTRDGPLASPVDVQRFRYEAEAVANLDHPHIVPVFEIGEHDGCHFFSMKLMEGGSLAEHLPRYRADLRATARLVAIIARAMHYAHQRGVRHRDLKPSNILLDATGQPHVSDFGLAQRDGDSCEWSTSGVIVGTAPYMAPEQAGGRKAEVTMATDVYGLGTILYALLTGRPPFWAGTQHETIRQVQQCDPARPRALNPAVDRDLETICLKCLEKDPQRR